MADVDWQKVREIFDSALRCKPGERQKLVVQACGEDTNLLLEVQSLLASLESAESFMETPIAAQAADLIKPDALNLSSGTSFSHYEIIKHIGAGGMGEVYLARDTNLNRQVALKLLVSHITEDKNRIARFRQEALATSALNHPNIVTIFEIGKWHDRDFIVTEFIEGETLRQTLEQKKLSAGESLDIAVQIASALGAAHSANIVHRDIKPENVMVRRDGLVKVLDFGIAKYRPAEHGQKALVETGVGEVIGTAAYMSPEQARGLETNAQTDIWSLGVIFYEMLAGQPPFRGETKFDRIAAVIERDPAPLAKIGGGKIFLRMQSIIDRALAKDKKNRYANIAEMTEDLHRLREATGDKLPPLILPIRKSVPAHRHYRFAAVSMIILLAGAIGLWLYFSYSKKTAGGDRKSIAVLPLKPINAANRDDIYEIGIADSLIQRLGTVKNFIVRPLSAVRQYADLEQDPLAAGREQQVNYVLASNYQTANGKIRVTSQLFNVETGQIEETYKTEKDASDVFAMQDAIGEDIGNLLQGHFAVSSNSSKDVRGTDNEEAYRLYLQAQYLIEKGGAANAKRSIELFDQALALDPNYAKAWAGKARAHGYFPLVGDRTPDQEYAVAKSALERALVLDPNLSEAYASRGVIFNDYDWNFAEADKQFLRAIELTPDSSLAYRWYARRLAGQGRYDEAITKIKTAIDLNPSSTTEQVVYGRILYFARQYDDAVAQLQRVLEIDPAQAEPYAYLWRCYHIKGDEQRAYENFVKFQQLVGTKDETVKRFQTVYTENGWRGTLQAALDVRQSEATTGNASYDAAILAALLNQPDRAFQNLEDAVKKRSANISNLAGDPGLDSLRGDSRFQDLLKKIGSPKK